MRTSIFLFTFLSIKSLLIGYGFINPLSIKGFNKRILMKLAIYNVFSHSYLKRSSCARAMVYHKTFYKR